MKLRTFRALWGVVRPADGPFTVKEALPAIKKLGYDGVEVPIKFALAYGKKEWGSLLQENELDCIYQVFTDGPVSPGGDGVFGPAISGHPTGGPSVDEHLAVFEDQVSHSYDIPNTAFVNAHSGADRWDLDTGSQFFEKALKFQKDEGVEVYHEGHRMRFLYSPWVAAEFVTERCPELKMTADFSHWTNVCETGPADPALNKAIDAVANNVYHIHARVGYEEGPQVADPRAPEWLPYGIHFRPFELIWQFK